MRRLRPGEFQAMTPEQQIQHKKALLQEWLSKPKNRKKMREWNSNYQKRRWEKIKTTPVERVCVKCGKTAMMTGKTKICERCKMIVSKHALEQMRIAARKEIRNEWELKIVNYAVENPDLRQADIADKFDTYQEIVSRILKKHGIKRKRVQNG